MRYLARRGCCSLALSLGVNDDDDDDNDDFWTQFVEHGSTMYLSCCLFGMTVIEKLTVEFDDDLTIKKQQRNTRGLFLDCFPLYV